MKLTPPPTHTHLLSFSLIFLALISFWSCTLNEIETPAQLEVADPLSKSKDYYNQEKTGSMYARTILHETLHAYLLFEKQYPSDCDLNCLLTNYISKHGGNDLNPSHHALFVETKFLNDIEAELKNFAIGVNYNVNSLGDQFFKDMAWGGTS